MQTSEKKTKIFHHHCMDYSPCEQTRFLHEA